MKRIYLVENVNAETNEIKMHFGAFTKLKIAQSYCEQLNDIHKNSTWIVEAITLDMI